MPLPAAPFLCWIIATHPVDARDGRVASSWWILLDSAHRAWVARWAVSERRSARRLVSSSCGRILLRPRLRDCLRLAGYAVELPSLVVLRVLSSLGGEIGSAFR